jgi:hypothetical protein
MMRSRGLRALFAVLVVLLALTVTDPSACAKYKKLSAEEQAAMKTKKKAEQAAEEKAAEEKAAAEKAALEQAAAEKAAALAAAPPPDVTRSVELADCIKCHQQPGIDIAKKGGAHRDKVTCLDCHEQHPPLVQSAIPLCSKCHAGQSHFELDNCLACHANPHMPLVMELEKHITGPCLTCHPEQGAQLEQNPSFHSRLNCTDCHQVRHGRVPLCFKCHKPHTDTMTSADCRLCHQAHKPLAITYGKDVPSESCGSCHADVYGMLAKSGAKHRGLACAACHAERHGNIPECTVCHGLPHAEQIHALYAKCGECHGIAHDLIPISRHRQR